LLPKEGELALSLVFVSDEDRPPRGLLLRMEIVWMRPTTGRPIPDAKQKAANAAAFVGDKHQTQPWLRPVPKP
jgi:hypothetical protein